MSNFEYCFKMQFLSKYVSANVYSIRIYGLFLLYLNFFKNVSLKDRYQITFSPDTEENKARNEKQAKRWSSQMESPQI